MARNCYELKEYSYIINEYQVVSNKILYFARNRTEIWEVEKYKMCRK